MKKQTLKRIGKEMQVMVRKAIKIIQDESHNLIVKEKRAYDVQKTDCATNGDKEAQAMYIGEIQRLFPTFGIIAEEQELTIPCTHRYHDIYFTVDPLDGTKAYARGQSHGVGTMIALVIDGNIEAAYIGDANTGEIYGYTTADKKGYAGRQRFGKENPLAPDINRPLIEQYIFLRDAPHTHPPQIQKLYRPVKASGAFKEIEVGGGSIGTLMARLWKGELGAVCINPHFETPWDLTPVLGITDRLGFVFLTFTENGLRVSKPRLITKVTRDKHFRLIVHKKHLPELRAWVKTNI